MATDTLTTSADMVVTRWTCDTDGCPQQCQVTLAEVVTIGTPLCPNCEEEMTLSDKVTAHPPCPRGPS